MADGKRRYKSDRKDYKVSVKLSEKDMDILKAALKRTGMTASAYIRELIRTGGNIDTIAADEATEQKTLSEREQKIYNMICENLHLSVEQVMAELDISRSTVFRDYAKIKKVTGAVYDKKTSTWTL